MALRRTDIVNALQAVVQGLSEVFPASVEIDAEDIGSWAPVNADAANPNLQHAANIVSGKFEMTIDGGSSTEWEGVRNCTLTYAVKGVDRPSRIARRDLAVPALIAALAGNRNLGLADLQVWAELGMTIEDDDAPIADAASASVAHIDINVTYVAASAAG